MARKSPRSRRKPEPPRVPGPSRPRAAPGRGRKSARKAEAAPGRGHGSEGARGAPRKTGKKLPLPRPRGTRPSRRPPAGALPSAPPARPARRPLAPRRRGRFVKPEPERVAAVLAILDRTYPGAKCALDFQNPLQLLVATILSAQCTDVRVNMVTPALFARYPDAAALASARLPELENMVRSTGFFRNKAKAIHAAAADIVTKHGGRVPRTLEELTALRGVGRKTANVVLGNAYDVPGLVVDTHVTRVSNRLGFVRDLDAVRIEFALMEIVPRETWTVFSHWLILHGRQICIARKPRCSICPLLPHCPRVGVTTSQ